MRNKLRQMLKNDFFFFLAISILVVIKGYEGIYPDIFNHSNMVVLKMVLMLLASGVIGWTIGVKFRRIPRINDIAFGAVLVVFSLGTSKVLATTSIGAALVVLTGIVGLFYTLFGVWKLAKDTNLLERVEKKKCVEIIKVTVELLTLCVALFELVDSLIQNV